MLLLRAAVRPASCASRRIAPRPVARRAAASSAPAPAAAASNAVAAAAGGAGGGGGFDLSMATPIDVGPVGSASRLEQALRSRFQDEDVQEEATGYWQHVWTAAVTQVNEAKDLTAKERQDYITELNELAKSTPPPEFAETYAQMLGLASVLGGSGDEINDEKDAEPVVADGSFTAVMTSLLEDMDTSASLDLLQRDDDIAVLRLKAIAMLQADPKLTVQFRNALRNNTLAQASGSLADFQAVLSQLAQKLRNKQTQEQHIASAVAATQHTSVDELYRSLQRDFQTQNPFLQSATQALFAPSHTPIQASALQAQQQIIDELADGSEPTEDVQLTADEQSALRSIEQDPEVLAKLQEHLARDAERIADEARATDDSSLAEEAEEMQRLARDPEAIKQLLAEKDEIDEADLTVSEPLADLQLLEQEATAFARNDTSTLSQTVSALATLRPDDDEVADTSASAAAATAAAAAAAAAASHGTGNAQVDAFFDRALHDGRRQQ